MDSRASMSSDVPSELGARSGTTLDALDHAASKAEQAAYRYRASTALPFTQLDFEAEHPEWSLSAYRTSSASSSRPASANGTMALYSRSSTSSASNRNLASANRSPASQAISLPSNPSQVVPRAQGRPRMLYPQEQGFSESDKKQACSWGELGHRGKVDGRAMEQRHRNQRSPPKDAAQYQSPTIRPSAMSNRKSHAGRVSNLSISSDATNSITGNVSASQAQDEEPRSFYREVVDPIIQSLNSHYEELYPQLDASAIRQEVRWPNCTFS